MTARYAVYDICTDRDVREFADLRSAYAVIDRLGQRRYGVRIARRHREQIDQSWRLRTVGGPLLRIVARSV